MLKLATMLPSMLLSSVQDHVMSCGNRLCLLSTLFVREGLNVTPGVKGQSSRSRLEEEEEGLHGIFL